MILFSCTACSQPLRAMDSQAGMRTKCPRCGCLMTIAAPLSAAVSTSSGAPPAAAAPQPQADPSEHKNAAEPTESLTDPVHHTVHGPASANQENRPTLPGTSQPLAGTLFDPPQMPDEIGRLADYRVLQLLGHGGMGAVFLAEDVSLHRRLALKIMRADLAADSGAQQRFLREARAAASVKHDHIVTIYSVGAHRGTPFLAMEFLEGESLETRLTRTPVLPIADVLRIGVQIAGGLAAAHARGLVHRDIKPCNIWLEKRPNGYRVKLLDFGLARTAADDVQLTKSGTIIGTPAYMSPEQARTLPVDARSDLYSLGCVLYRACTGELPIRGETTMALLASLLIERAQPVGERRPDLPGPFADLVMRLLAKNPQDRPQSADEIHTLLETIQAEYTSESTLPWAIPVISVVESTGMIVPTPSIVRPSPERTMILVEEASTAPAAKPALRPSSSGRGRWRVVAAALVALIFLLGVGALFFLGRKSATGQLSVRSEEPNVQLRIFRQGRLVALLDPATHSELALEPGEYQVELAEQRPGLRLSVEKFALADHGKVTVSVERDGKPAAAVQQNLEPRVTAHLLRSKPLGPDVSNLHAAAMRLPHVYIVDLLGNLWIFKLSDGPPQPGIQTIREIATLPSVGDGRALMVIQDYLLCSRLGSLEVFALTNPAAPRYVGHFGPEINGGATQSIVRHGTLAFLIGPGCVSTFDVSNPAAPRHLGVIRPDSFFWNGCVLGTRLYIAEIDVPYFKGTRRTGIAVFDIANPGAPKELSFVTTELSPYHLLPVDNQRMLVLMDGKIQFYSGADPLKPAPLGSAIAEIGRTGALLSSASKHYLVTRDHMFLVEERGLKNIGTLMSGGTRDGLPYQCWAEGDRLIISMDAFAAELRLVPVTPP